MRESTWNLRRLTFTGLEWGERLGTPTLLLHGYLDHAGSWSRVAAGLVGWRLAFDARGHGRSPHVTQGETYHFPEYLADVDALIGALGAPVNLVGHSMGGTIATMYAGARPDRVRRVVSIDGLGMPDAGEVAAERLVQFLDGVADPPSHKIFPDVATAASRLRRANPQIDEAWALELAVRTTTPVDGGLVWSWDVRHRIRGAIPYRQANHQQLLRRIACPVLSVRPEHSPFMPADVGALESTITNLVTATIRGAGHMVHLDAPSELSAVIQDFLAE